MIAKVMRGEKVGGLIRYLYSASRDEDGRNFHTNPRIVAGWAPPETLEPQAHEDGTREGRLDFRPLVDGLNAPLAALARQPEQPVYHVPLRLAPEDPVLSDEQWAEIAEHVMTRLGLGGPDDPGGCRWVAIRHANDHVHLVVTLARQDRVRVNLWGDFGRLGEARRELEGRYDLRRTAPPDGTAARAPTKAEMQRASRGDAGLSPSGAQPSGRPVTARERLRQAVQRAAAGADSTEAFVERLRAGGVAVELRYSVRDPGVATGYKVSLPNYTAVRKAPDGSLSEGPVWYSGGRLAADLTLPKLQGRWGEAPTTPLGPGRGEDATWKAAKAAVTRARGPVRDQALARAAGELLDVVATGSQDPALLEALRRYDRAYREPAGRTLRAGRQAADLRQAAVALAAIGRLTGDREKPPLLALSVGLVSLLEAVGDLRAAQDRVHQVAAARDAAAAVRQAVDQMLRAGDRSTARSAYAPVQGPQRGRGR